jgi:hypothetical protein
MKNNLLSLLCIRGRISRILHGLWAMAALSAAVVFTGCSSGEIGLGPNTDRGAIVQTPTNFEAALKSNEAALLQRKGAPDIALYNIGVILAHPSNPKKDQPRALHMFQTLVAEHPRSVLVEQSKTWIQVLEQQQKVAEEKQKVAEEKRALSRHREMLLQERQKLNYANEKSQQLDMEIEKRRRQSLSK